MTQCCKKVVAVPFDNFSWFPALIAHSTSYFTAKFAEQVRATTMFGIFASTPQAPERVPTDHVTPVGCFDDTIIFKTFVMYTAFVFPEALDAKKLRSSLESVVSRPGWNKLGARLRINVRYTPNGVSPKIRCLTVMFIGSGRA